VRKGVRERIPLQDNQLRACNMYNSMKLATHSNVPLYCAICALSLLFFTFISSLSSLLKEMKEEDGKNKKAEEKIKKKSRERGKERKIC
jgi:hypothetical protein